MPKVLPEELAPYVFHGVHLSLNGTGSQATGDCPFCGREQKFYVNIENTLADCKGCGWCGNSVEFLRKYYEVSTENTDDAQYEELKANRKFLSIDTLKKWGLVFGRLRDEWLLPGYYYGSDKLKNLYRYTDYLSKEGKKRLWSTTGFDQCLYGIQTTWNDAKEDVWILEGAWDGMAVWELMRCIKSGSTGYEPTSNENASLLANVNIMCIPSANVFNEHWAKLLTNKRVFLFPHNDHPKVTESRVSEPVAWAGAKRIVRILIENQVGPKEIQYLSWSVDGKDHDSDLKHGYDVRDLLTEGYFPSGQGTGVGARLKEIERRGEQLDRLFSMLRPVPNHWIDPTAKGDEPINLAKPSKGVVRLQGEKCNDWNTLVAAWQDSMVFHYGLNKALCCMLSVITSTPCKGSQLWMKIVGPPSVGKSVLCDAISENRDYVTPKSNIRGFYSGVRSGNDSDLGLIAEIMGKTFVTKDGDTLLQSDNKEKLMAEARDLYDGKSETHFKTGTGREYRNMRTTWLLCGTDSLRVLDTSELGERFLDCILIDDVAPELEEEIGISSIMRMAQTMTEEVTKDADGMDDKARSKAKKLTVGYIDYLRNNWKEPLEVIKDNFLKDKVAIKHIYDLGLFVSYMRGRPSAKQEEKATRELAARLPEQLTRLAQCMAIVLNKKAIDTEVLSRVREIAFDTARGTTFDIIKELYSKPRGLTDEAIIAVTKSKKERILELLRFLRRIKALDLYTEEHNSMQGMPHYCLSVRMRDLCKRIFDEG